MDSSKETPPATPSSQSKDDSYSEIIDQGIDALNTAESFQGTDLRNEEPKVQRKSYVFASLWFKLLLVLCIASAGLFGYYKKTEIRAVTPERADEQLRKRFGEEYADIISWVLGED